MLTPMHDRCVATLSVAREFSPVGVCQVWKGLKVLLVTRIARYSGRKPVLVQRISLTPAICKPPMLSASGKTRSITRLSIDHVLRHPIFMLYLEVWTVPCIREEKLCMDSARHVLWDSTVRKISGTRQRQPADRVSHMKSAWWCILQQTNKPLFSAVRSQTLLEEFHFSWT